LKGLREKPTSACSLTKKSKNQSGGTKISESTKNKIITLENSQIAKMDGSEVTRHEIIDEKCSALNEKIHCRDENSNMNTFSQI